MEELTLEEVEVFRVCLNSWKDKKNNNLISKIK